MAKKNDYLFCFPEPPPIGTRIRLSWRTGLVELYKIEPYTRRDGVRSAVLWWVSDDGRVGTTGLSSRYVSWWRL